jgi:transposase
MFVRKKTSKSNPNIYFQLAESYREGNSVKQRIIKHIGTAKDEHQAKQMQILGEKLKNLYELNHTNMEIEQYYQKEISKIHQSSPSLFNCEKIRTKKLGLHDIYGKILDEIGISNILKTKKYSVMLKDLIMAKIAKPSSKRKAVETLSEDFGIDHKLNDIYKMMDLINENIITQIQRKISEYSKCLLSGAIHILYYDVTTIYFESFTEDEIKKLGFSKDNKFNQPQLVLTMLVSEGGLPLGYQLLPGNTYEGNTLITAIKSWRDQYPDKRFTLVADSGLLNELNISILEQEKIDYIVAARIKNLPNVTKDEIFGIKELSNRNEDWFFDIKSNNNRRLVISYKVNRASKDKYDREKNINKLMSKLKVSKNPSSFINNYGYKKFIDIDGGSKITINESKISEQERWDGLHGIITNVNDLSAKEIYSQYRGLWQIEDAFRINKTDLKIRPVFHWTFKRILSHICLSYITYACYKSTEFILHNQGISLSHRAIKDKLDKVEATIYKDKTTQEVYFFPEQIEEETKEIYKIFNVIPENQPYCCTLMYQP